MAFMMKSQRKRGASESTLCSRCVKEEADERVNYTRILPSIRTFEARSYCSWDCFYSDFSDTYGRDSVACRAVSEVILSTQGRSLRYVTSDNNPPTQGNRPRATPMNTNPTEEWSCRFLSNYAPSHADIVVTDE